MEDLVWALIHAPLNNLKTLFNDLVVGNPSANANSICCDRGAWEYANNHHKAWIDKKTWRYGWISEGQDPQRISLSRNQGKMLGGFLRTWTRTKTYRWIPEERLIERPHYRDVQEVLIRPDNKGNPEAHVYRLLRDIEMWFFLPLPRPGK